MRTFPSVACPTPNADTACRFLVLFLVLLVFVNCSDDTPSSDANSDTDETSFRKDGSLTFFHTDGSPEEIIEIEIADTEEARRRGLMFRQELGYNRGMLFIFERPSTGGFWMKDTPLPLDIMFIDEDSTIINIARRTTPFSEENIYPDRPRLYVVEVRGGFAAMHGIEAGMTIDWTRDPAPVDKTSPPTG